MQAAASFENAKGVKYEPKVTFVTVQVQIAVSGLLFRRTQLTGN